LTHELVRHRAGFGYSQLSQRYVDESDAAFVVPPAIQGDEAAEAAWLAQMESAQKSYVQAVNHLMEKYSWVEDKTQRRKMAREAGRSVLPNGTETKIVVSGNIRAWRTMLELRLGEGAEREIRRMAVTVLETLRAETPRFFADFELYSAEDGAQAGRVTYHKI
jgi:thymidylate synthase (FAD)